jgi:hypothetical protein
MIKVPIQGWVCYGETDDKLWDLMRFYWHLLDGVPNFWDTPRIFGVVINSLKKKQQQQLSSYSKWTQIGDDRQLGEYPQKQNPGQVLDLLWSIHFGDP